MPASVTCPTCDARVKVPDGSAGRTLRCPRCAGRVVVPTITGPAAHFSVDPATTPPHDEGSPFEDEAPPDGPGPEADGPRRWRRPTAKRKPTPGFNPFDADPGEASGAAPPKKRRYRRDGDYNPFGDLPDQEEPNPVGEGFEFGLEVSPPAPTGEFDFGPPDPRGVDDAGPGRRR